MLLPHLIQMQTTRPATKKIWRMMNILMKLLKALQRTRLMTVACASFLQCASILTFYAACLLYNVDNCIKTDLVLPTLYGLSIPKLKKNWCKLLKIHIAIAVVGRFYENLVLDGG